VTTTRQPLVIAHRGASADAPENTVEAFRLAALQGADWVELDVRRTADDHLAVVHNAHLPDLRLVLDCDRADLPQSVPSLAEALDACLGMGVNIEIKNSPEDPDYEPTDSVADGVVDLLEKRGGDDLVLISSFTDHTVARVRERAPHLATAFLVQNEWVQTVGPTAVAGHRAIHPKDADTTAEGVAAARAAGLDVNVWTVDDPDRMRALVAMGVTGIVTNRPAVARATLDA
jgi:glycerophosphoryl diester phosphodiesterase